MADYRKPYFALFNAITEALMYLELGAYEDVRDILVEAQQTGEELVISQSGEEGEGSMKAPVLGGCGPEAAGMRGRAGFDFCDFSAANEGGVFSCAFRRFLIYWPYPRKREAAHARNSGQVHPLPPGRY